MIYLLFVKWRNEQYNQLEQDFNIYCIIYIFQDTRILYQVVFNYANSSL